MADEVKKSAKETEAQPAVAEPAVAPGAEAPAGAEQPVRRAKARGSKHVPAGIVYINATFNNTTVTITDLQGNVVCWSSGGRCGFKGSRKSTAYAATVVAQDAARQAVAQGMHEVEIRVQGPGAGRESAIRAVQAAGLSIAAIRDITPMPHNGCRPPKRRRV
jgi:small subunit ribosomal protein S11